jgi:hypothetical protein
MKEAWITTLRCWGVVLNYSFCHVIRLPNMLISNAVSPICNLRYIDMATNLR